MVQLPVNTQPSEEQLQRDPFFSLPHKTKFKWGKKKLRLREKFADYKTNNCMKEADAAMKYCHHFTKASQLFQFQ